MKAARIHAYGDPDLLKYEDVPDPIPDKGEILIDVAGSGVNPIDWKLVTGQLRDVLNLPLPIIPGVEVSGTIQAPGEGVEGFAVGDPVFGVIGYTGGYATRAVAPAAQMARPPKSLPLREAGGLAVVALTAWQALHEQAGVRSGQRVLVHGSAGGVGGFAVQIARAAGAEVIATASTANLDYVRSLGASTVIDYTRERFERVVSGVDVVLDLIGGDTQDRSWAVLKPGGVLVSTVSPPFEEKARSVGAHGKFFTLRPDAEQLRTIAALIDEGKLRFENVEVMPLSRAAEALKKYMTAHVQGRDVPGKLVLDAAS
jgi:NADPH:quinone reductase-like Zn-dependent oxidoreductase